jgi:hypothetical protein
VSPQLSKTTPMKTLEHGRLQRTDRLSPTVAYHTVLWGRTHFKLALSLDTTSILDARISSEAFKRNPPQPRELT